MARNIPERWLNYKPIGKRIEGTRFIAFKVPLRECINEGVHEEQRLDANILMKTIPNLGMIIDLTNTTRYYNPHSLMKKGLEYSKLMIPGHHTPPPNLVNQFKKLVMTFLKNNACNDKLIGVHCTHGVNRTGYLICNYMISELNAKPEEAINKFNVARGHKIERTNYLDSLYDLAKRKQGNNSQRRDHKDNSIEKNLQHKRFNKMPRQAPIPLRAPLDPVVLPSPKVYDRRNRFDPSQEPMPLRAPPNPVVLPSPKVFDRRNRFERFRLEANTHSQRYSRQTAATSPSTRQYRTAPRNDTNYNRADKSYRSQGDTNYSCNKTYRDATHSKMNNPFFANAPGNRQYNNKPNERQYKYGDHDRCRGERRDNKY
ncbi:RNA/RNP complex-1-interacting phosphatase [Anastrepha ludens]|uniref:RNA/RNP complex-1-interacting phosphatase n=1 Tax=Anastrepha ludens TaxID=28586 RepID=UPI0023B0F1D8|nr:RNA/RNP complex-1-interacting phosphatase [Anastrepha ludens]